MDALDLALVASIGALLAVLALWVTRPPRRATRTYDGATVRKVREYQTPGALIPVTEPEPEPAALVPYQPNPLIRIDTGRLPADIEQPGWEFEKRTPHRAPTLEADVFVPGLQAGMTALAVGIGAAMLAWAAAWSWRVPVAVCGATFVLSWLWRLRIVDGLLWTVESIIRRDVTGDNVIGQPAHAFTLANPSEARSEAAQETRQNADSERRAELLAFLDRCLLVGCSESAQGINPAGRADYLQKRDVLMQLGIAAWKSPDRPRAGWHIVVSHERARQLLAKHVL